MGDSERTVPDLYVVARNQDDVAMSSVEGELLTIALLQDEILLHTQPADLFLAEVLFFNLPVGRYQVMAVHEAVNPAQAQQTVQINSQTVVIGVRFIYSEPERQLLRAEVREFRVDE
ncbi:MAG: hypothetical protein LH702_12630 [Phormidesmis sp. CAN_BIN44]|nr:hypothetical protein [Phormidesmis sp. CAN_BIN44]